MPQVAYDLAVFENRPEKARQKAPMRVAKGNKLRTVRAAWNQMTAIAVGGVLLALLCSLLYSQARLTALTADIQQYQRQLSSAQNEYDYLSSTLDQITTEKNVEQVAAQLGMMKLDPSQITYMLLEQQSQITLPENSVDHLTQSISEKALSLMSYLNP